MDRRLVMSAALLACLASLGGALDARATSERSLRSAIGAGRAQERSVAAAAARLGRLEAATQREVTILEGRVAAAQQDLDQARALAAQTAARLGRARRRLAHLAQRLAVSRVQLAELLRARYETAPPDLITVVLESSGFAQLLETVSYEHRIQQHNAEVLATVRSAKADAARERRVLAGLDVRRQAAVVAVTRRRDALAGIAAGLRARRDALAAAHRARLALLSSVRARRLHAEKELARLIAARERAALTPGPGGPWAIPWPIVQCESGGTNTPPNSATASGYYQITDATWRGLGGSTRHAYQASRAEQDRLAARLWAGGAGAHNWVCAALVGAL
jgi:peptidoglycan hydrolase CwlO-like protein